MEGNRSVEEKIKLGVYNPKQEDVFSWTKKQMLLINKLLDVFIGTREEFSSYEKNIRENHRRELTEYRNNLSGDRNALYELFKKDIEIENGVVGNVKLEQLWKISAIVDASGYSDTLWEFEELVDLIK